MRKVVGLVWLVQVCSEMTETVMLTRTFLGELLVTVILAGWLAQIPLNVRYLVLLEIIEFLVSTSLIIDRLFYVIISQE